MSDDRRQRRKDRARGTVVDPSSLIFQNSGDDQGANRVGAVGYVDESGKPVSTQDRVQSNIRFPSSRSIAQPIWDGVPKSTPPSATTKPNRTVLKSFNMGSLCVNESKLQRSIPCEYEHSEKMKEDFLHDYGLPEEMKRRVLSQCSKIYHLTVLLDNDYLMNKEDAKFIKGRRKDAEWLGLPDEKRLANNTLEYNLSVESCLRHTGLQDVSFFLLQLAAAMALPATFELCNHKAGGLGNGFRRIVAPEAINNDSKQQGASKMSKAEDYIPYGDQVESALEMIEQLPSNLRHTDGSFDLIKEVKSYCEREIPRIEKEEKNIQVAIITASYPQGARAGGGDERFSQFVELLNDFATLPVTFIFVLETQDKAIIQFYDQLVASGSGVKADVKIAKGLGLMLDGISKYNPWLNYCLPMHLCQVLGICSNILSQAAIRPLFAAEVRELCDTLIGDVPDPLVDMDEFYGAIRALMAKVDHTMWNPANGCDTPLINTVKLKRTLEKSPRNVGLLVAFVVCVVAVIVSQLRGSVSFGG